MSAEEGTTKAEAVKDEGNALFKMGRYADAVAKYNEAVELDPEVPAYYTNRAFCHLKMENHGLAIADATVALELDKTYFKAYYRRGSAHMALGRYKEALKDFKSVRQLKPNDKDAFEKFKAAEKEVKRVAFEKAIHSDSPADKPVAEQLDIENMPVESGYAGPRPTFPLSSDMVLEIAQHLKEQKQLHRKFVFQILIAVKEQLDALPTLVDVPIPDGTHINVCGDTHGQYYDLLNIFETFGVLSSSSLKS